MPLFRPLVRLSLLTALAATPAAAQRVERLFVWAGRVDREAILVLRGRDLDVRVDGRADRDDWWRGRGRGRDDGRDDGRERVLGAVPRADGFVTVAVDEGRGRVDVVQQPTARNGWTTVVRVRDDRGGDDRYRLVARWQPTGRDAGWGWGGAGGRGRDDGRWDDRRDDGDWRDGDRRDRDDDRRACARDDWECVRAGARDDLRAELRWRGEVDDVAELRIQGRRIDVTSPSGAGTRDASTRVAGGGLPARPVAVRVRTLDGRGDVRVVQQPSAWNGWTAVVRVRDPQGGFGRYDLAIDW